MPNWNSSPARRYGLALAAVALAVGLRSALDPWFGPNVPFITLFAAVAFVTWYAGTGPAVLASAIGVVACAWLFFPRRLLLDGHFASAVLVLLVFAVGALLIVLLGERARRSGVQARDALERVRESEGQLHLLVDALPMLISYVDRSLHYRFNNQAYRRWFGEAHARLEGRPVREVLGESAFAAVEPPMRRALAGETVHWEQMLPYRTAGERHVSITYVPHRVGDEVHGFFAVVEDISARREAEIARAHLAAIFESTGDAVVSKDLEGRVQSWNTGAERLYGYRADEIVGTSIMRLIPPELAEEEQRILAKIRDGETVHHLETERLRKDGTRVPVSLTVSPIRDADGRVVGASKIARNISKRLQAMRALQASEARFRTLADNAPMLIWRADVENRGIWFNRQWLEFTGRTLEQELGEGWTECIHPEDRERVYATCSAHSARREIFEMEFRMRRRDGVYRWVLDRGAPMFDGPQGEFTGYIGSSIDISERKYAIEQLAQAHRRKDEFLATLAHELRNPLAPILNAAQFLRHKPSEDPAQRTGVEIIERQARHMTRLVDDLLDVSRISRGKIVLRRGVLRLDLAVNAAVEAARPAIEGAGHTLRVDLPTELYVDGDLTRLSQVFGNLLNNAAKYTPPGGLIEIAGSEDASVATVRIKDSGVGLDAEALDQVFEMFTQVGRDDDHRQGGLGIGLHLARQLVQLHGGSIEARSAGPGHGSEFIVRLPRVQPTAPLAEPRIPSVAPSESRFRLLLVDDSADVRRSVSLMLELDGHEVHLAQDGVQAVEAVRELHPDLVLMDIGMPRMNGYDAARAIRGLKEGRHLHLVALTGWGQEEDRRLALEAGFDEHWTKPIEIDALRRVVARVAERRRREAQRQAAAS